MTEDKDSICCSWYESCTYYMQCEYLYNENKDLSEDVYRLEQENKEIYENGQIEITKLCNEKTKYRSALEEINRVVKLAHKVEDYSLGQDYTDLVDRIEKEVNEVLQ